MLIIAMASLAGFLVVGNGAILAAHALAHRGASGERPTVDGVRNFRVVDAKLWRGGHPSEIGYRSLAAAGVGTIIDLRAESIVHLPTALLDELGLDVVRIPMRDGQAPSREQVGTFLASVAGADGTVYVHCMAGVGRTGAMIGAYLLETTDASTTDVLEGALAVGPPSLEQLAFLGADAGQPNQLVTGVSRLLDAPRRIWSYVK